MSNFLKRGEHWSEKNVKRLAPDPSDNIISADQKNPRMNRSIYYYAYFKDQKIF